VTKADKTFAVIAAVCSCLFFASCASMKVSPSNARSLIVRTAKNMLEKKYEFGKNNPGSGFDCSGLSQYSYKQAGVDIPRTARKQYENSKKISKGDLKNADLVFFSTNGPGPTHVGIYIGGGRFIHSPSEGKRVQIVDMDNPYWRVNYYGSGTYFK